MEQIERIRRMEQALDSCTAALEALDRALEQYAAVQGSLAALEEYYGGPLWRKDFEDDSKGLLPQTLRRGVLSEDALYNLLVENDCLVKRLRELSGTQPD